VHTIRVHTVRIYARLSHYTNGTIMTINGPCVCVNKRQFFKGVPLCASLDIFRRNRMFHVEHPSDASSTHMPLKLKRENVAY
jgi:hypothetical protein